MPKGIRPTKNKVRKALFDILGDIEGLSFLELFAGSGGVSFEAVSRGAAELTLVEDNRDCLPVIRKNIESLALKSCSLYPLEAEKAIRGFHNNKRKFNIIFLDPPYFKGKVPRLRSGLAGASINDSLAKKTLLSLAAYDILAPNGFIVIQHFKKDNIPEAAGDLRLFRQSRYGDTVLSFYRKCAR